MFEQIKAEEATKQQELKTQEAQARAEAEKAAIEHEKVRWEEQRRSMQQDAQTKAQLAQYQDELARKRQDAEHDKQRQRNAELVALQEESSRRQEEERRRIAEAIEAERRATERYKSELEKQVAREKALAEAEGRAQERRVNEDIYRRELAQKLEEHRKAVVEGINATFSHLGDGARALLDEPRTLAAFVGGATALAVGVYFSREGAKVAGKAAETWLGTPKLVRETSRKSLFGAGNAAATGGASRPFFSGPAGKKTADDVARDFGDIILPGELKHRVRGLAAATANSKRHGAPFRHMLFFGPPGTGKTLAAKRLARTSGLDYAILSGGDVAPLGGKAVSQLHDVFDWASKSRKGLMLFVDEADAFLARRGARMSEGLRGALNATLYRTGDQSRDFVVVLATNRPEDLDPAVLDRMDEAIEFPLPGADEREQLLKLYFEKYVERSAEDAAGADAKSMVSRFLATLRGRRADADAIRVDGVDDADLRKAAEQTLGFSGRELAKTAASLQAAAYGTPDARLTREMFWKVIEQKKTEHNERRGFVQLGDEENVEVRAD